MTVIVAVGDKQRRPRHPPDAVSGCSRRATRLMAWNAHGGGQPGRGCTRKRNTGRRTSTYRSTASPGPSMLCESRGFGAFRDTVRRRSFARAVGCAVVCMALLWGYGDGEGGSLRQEAAARCEGREWMVGGRHTGLRPCSAPSPSHRGVNVIVVVSWVSSGWLSVGSGGKRARGGSEDGAQWPAWKKDETQRACCPWMDEA